MSNDSYAQDFYGESSDSFEFQRSAELGAHFAYLQSGPEAAVLASVETGLIDETNGGPTTIMETIKDAFDDSLIARDIDVDELSISQFGAFELAATQIDTILNSDIETSDDVTELLGDEVNVSFVDDFTATDGTDLNGVAVLETDEIIIDSALEGEELRETLAEEVAETAYQQAYGTTSAGDFGAEVLARIEGLQDEDLLAEYTAVGEADTVETEFGTAEAYADRDAVDPVIDDIIAGNSNLSSGAAATVDEDEFDRIFSEVNGLTGGGGTNLFGESPYEILTGLDGNINSYDIDGDGNSTTKITYFIDNYGYSVPGTETAEIVGGATTGTLLPIDGKSSTLFGSASESAYTDFSITLSEGEQYTTSESFTWSAGVSVTGKAGFLGSGTEVTVEASTGETLTESNTVTASTSVTYNGRVYQSDYEEGDTISYGLHTLILNEPEIEDFYSIYFEASDADGVEGHFAIDVYDTQTISDFYYDVVQTDVNVNDMTDVPVNIDFV